MFKKISLLVALCLLGLVLYGCGGGGDEPAAVVEKAMNTLISGDADALDDLVCADMLSQAKQGAKEVKKGLEEEGGKVELSEMTYTVVEQKDDKATVEVKGHLKASHPQYGEMEDDVSETMDVIKEDGKWKVCQGLM